MQVLGIKTSRPKRLEFVARAQRTSFPYSKSSCRAKKSGDFSSQRPFQNLLNCGCSRNGQSTTQPNLEILFLSAEVT